MNEEKYFLNDEYESANEHAEFDLDDFDLENDEDVEKLCQYVYGLQSKLSYLYGSMYFQKDREEEQEKRHREFKSETESLLLKIFQDQDEYLDWIELAYKFVGGYSFNTDSKLAFFCVNKAAELSDNDSYTCYLLGECYENGCGAEKSFEKAFEYYSIAAKDENPYFIEKLSECYKKGIGTPIDEKKALELYEKAKQIKNEYRKYSQDENFEAYKKNLTETTEVTTKNVNSWIAFADCYKNGRGTERNLEKAKECYERVLAFYEKTDTTAKNYRIVLKRFEEINNDKISKQEQRISMEKELTDVTKNNVNDWITLGDLYRKYKPKNYEKAYECYKKVFNFYEQTKEYDENYRRTLKRLLLCFDKGIGSESEEERNAIRKKLIDYGIAFLQEKGYI